jgi:hypothetical protein
LTRQDKTEPAGLGETNILFSLALLLLQHTVKPAYAVTSIKQSPLLKDHLFLVLT